MPIYCNRCGIPNDEQASYCKQCGAALRTTGVQSGAGAVPIGGTATATSTATIYGTPMPTMVEYAGFWRRFAASIIDGIVLGAVGGVAGVIIALGLMTGAAGTLALYPLIIVGGWLYFALMESSSKQGTLGKMALRIIVTDMNGNRISFGRASGRFFAKWLSGVIIYIGYLMIAWTDQKQGLHDMVAGTLVVLK